MPVTKFNGSVPLLRMAAINLAWALLLIKTKDKEIVPCLLLLVGDLCAVIFVSKFCLWSDHSSGLRKDLGRVLASLITLGFLVFLAFHLGWLPGNIKLSQSMWACFPAAYVSATSSVSTFPSISSGKSMPGFLVESSNRVSFAWVAPEVQPWKSRGRRQPMRSVRQ